MSYELLRSSDKNHVEKKMNNETQTAMGDGDDVSENIVSISKQQQLIHCVLYA